MKKMTSFNQILGTFVAVLTILLLTLKPHISPAGVSYKGVPYKENIEPVKPENKKTKVMGNLSYENQLEVKYGLPKGMLRAVHLTETSGRCKIKSNAGAVGCFQFTKQTITEVNRLFKYKFDPYNYKESAKAAAMYLAYLSKRIDALPIRKEDKLLWLAAAYNAGFSNVKKWVYKGRIGFSETYKYAFNVVKKL